MRKFTVGVLYFGSVVVWVICLTTWIGYLLELQVLYRWGDEHIEGMAPNSAVCLSIFAFMFILLGRWIDTHDGPRNAK
jgi:hypothetical protein